MDFKNDRGVVVSRGCGAENDITARQCSHCGNTLIDPNRSLEKKSYTRDDFVDVPRRAHVSHEGKRRKGETPNTPQGFSATYVVHLRQITQLVLQRGGNLGERDLKIAKVGRVRQSHGG